MIYFDNSASTYIKPKNVINALLKGATKFAANPGRSGHKLSNNAAIEIENVRSKVCDFLNCENVVFTQNCTDALNLALQGSVKHGGHIICTVNEHNSVLRVLYEMQSKHNLEISVAEPSVDGKITVQDIEKHMQNNTYLVVCNHMSNVDGCIADIKKIGEFCHVNCLLFAVDAAQSAGHVKIDMQKCYVDLLALAPHKALYAVQGVGVLAYSKKANLQPIRYGGTGTESTNLMQPTSSIESYESGTVSTPNIIALGAALDFVNENFQKIKEKIDDLSTYLNYELSNIKNVKVYTHPNNSYGVISFNIKDFGSTEVSSILSEKYNIATRGGLHCAPLKHKHLNTLQQGTVRASLCYFNTFSECEKLVKAVKQIAKD